VSRQHAPSEHHEPITLFHLAKKIDESGSLVIVRERTLPLPDSVVHVVQPTFDLDTNPTRHLTSPTDERSKSSVTHTCAIMYLAPIMYLIMYLRIL